MSRVSISEASHILGVSETALRQWTDEGKVKAFVTPGGHRRYSTAELRRFMGAQQRTHGIKDLVAELEEAAPIHREVAQSYFHSTSWYGKLTPEARGQLGESGKRLLGLAIQYVAEPQRREETMELVHEVGRDFGGTLAGIGLSLTDSLEAFILHRNPVVNASARLMKRSEPLDRRVVAAIPLVTQIMDEALVSLVAAHQGYLGKGKASRGSSR